MDDDPHALQLLLDVVHCDSSEFEFPGTLSFRELFDLAKLCEKYEVAYLFEGRAHDWIREV